MKNKNAKSTKVFPTGLIGLVVILIATSLALPHNSFARGKPPGAGGKPPGAGGELFDDLLDMLVDDQKDDVKAVLDAHRGKFENARSKSEHEEIKNSLENGIRALLTTDEQERELDKIMEEMDNIGPPER